MLEDPARAKSSGLNEGLQEILQFRVTDLMVGSMSCCCTSSMNTFIGSLSGSLYTKIILNNTQNF
jgi:hypothetical protein